MNPSPVRICAFCEGRMSRLCRSNQIYCRPRCKHRAHRERLKGKLPTVPSDAPVPTAEPSPERARVEPTPPAASISLPPPVEGSELFASLEAALSQVPEAAAYRLAQASKRSLVPSYFPAPGQPIPRLDGTRSDAPFGLRPRFEPPLVPEAGLYAVQILDAQGKELKLPRCLFRGVTLPKWPPEEAAPSGSDPPSRPL
jgi:hypothetical protein